MKQLTALIFIGLLIPSYVQKTNTPNNTLIKTPVREVVVENSKEPKAYKLLYETAQKSNDSLRGTRGSYKKK